jgi:hypothetical protein
MSIITEKKNFLPVSAEKNQKKHEIFQKKA